MKYFSCNGYRSSFFFFFHKNVCLSFVVLTLTPPFLVASSPPGVHSALSMSWGSWVRKEIGKLTQIKLWQIFAHWGTGMRVEAGADFSSECFFSWAGEWLKKMRHVYTMEYYSDKSGNKSGSPVETWTDLETVIQNKVNQKERNKYSLLTHMLGI